MRGSSAFLPFDEGELAALDAPHGNRIEVHALEAAHVHGPDVGAVAGTAERQDAADGTEVVVCLPGVPRVDAHLPERREHADVAFLHAVVQRAARAADGAVAHPDMVEIRIDLAPDLSAVAPAAIGLLHGDLLSVELGEQL